MSPRSLIYCFSFDAHQLLGFQLNSVGNDTINLESPGLQCEELVSNLQANPVIFALIKIKVS
jgi:hypothetical protein